MKNILFLLILITLFLISGCAEEIGYSELEKGIEKTEEKSVYQEGSVEEPVKEILKEETIVEDKGKAKTEESEVEIGGYITLTNLHRDQREDRIIVIFDAAKFEFGRWDTDYIFIDYSDMEKDKEGIYSIRLSAPKIPGKYKIMLVEYKDNQPIHTVFNLTVTGKIKTLDEVLLVAERELYLNEEGWYIEEEGYQEEIIYDWNVTNREVNFVNDKWHINLTSNYEFGCCSSCGPNQMEEGMPVGCAAVCTPCGTKTIEGYFKIDKIGIIGQQNIREIACKENIGVWYNSRELIGGNCSF